MNYFWTKEEVLEKLDAKMTSTFWDVTNLSDKKKLFMREAAYVIAIDRVSSVCKLRAWV